MADVIHFSEKHMQNMVEGFQQASETEALFSHDIDAEFHGVKSVHVKHIKTYPLQDYDRTKEVGTGSRYGKTFEVGDDEQVFTMTQDKSLSLSVDKGNNAEQFNMKGAGKIMKAERNEQIIPALDNYRMGKWSKDAGIHFDLTEAPTKSNICSQIMELKNKMLDAGVPENGLRLLVKRAYATTLKLSDEWTGLDSLGGKTLPKGTLGEFDGMATKFVTNARFPANAAFMIIHKGAVFAPMKIQDMKLHKNPQGLNGQLLEFRMLHDAFVLGKKANGVAVGCLPSTVAAEPTIAIDGGKATITGTGTIYYTTDGSDPRYSVEVKTYTGAVTVAAGDTVCAYASAEGKWDSAVAKETV